MNQLTDQQQIEAMASALHLLDIQNNERARTVLEQAAKRTPKGRRFDTMASAINWIHPLDQPTQAKLVLAVELTRDNRDFIFVEEVKEITPEQWEQIKSRVPIDTSRISRPDHVTHNAHPKGRW
jgi:hypothetical protein